MLSINPLGLAVLRLLSAIIWGLAGMGALAHPEEGQKAQNIRLFKPLAEKGDAMAQFNLAVLYATGHGVHHDDREAVKWFRRSAEQGVVHAQQWLGKHYAEGRGVKRDAITAHMWFSLAAAKGNEAAAKARDELVKKMPSGQIAEAQKRAEQCAARQYRNCA